MCDLHWWTGQCRWEEDWVSHAPLFQTDYQPTTCWDGWVISINQFNLHFRKVMRLKSVSVLCWEHHKKKKNRVTELQTQTFMYPVILFCRFKPNEGVIIIGATNFPEALDKYVYLRVSCYSLCKCLVTAHISKCHVYTLTSQLPRQQQRMDFWGSFQCCDTYIWVRMLTHLLFQCPDPPRTLWHAGDCPQTRRERTHRDPQLVFKED